jgi:hypothetical protein
MSTKRCCLVCQHSNNVIASLVTLISSQAGTTIMPSQLINRHEKIPPGAGLICAVNSRGGPGTRNKNQSLLSGALC